jgi:hypothetical protein
MLSNNVIRRVALSVLVPALLLQGCTTAPTQRQLQQAVAVLEQGTDPDSLTAAAVLLPLVQPAGAEPTSNAAAARALLVRATTAAPARAELVWLEIQQCRGVPGCDPGPEELRLRNLDPSNGVVWINAMARADASNDEAEKDAVFRALARNERVDVYWTTLTVHLTRALAATHEIALPDALVEVSGALQVIPAYRATSSACKGERLDEPAILGDCRRIASAMEQGDTYITESMGVDIAMRVWPVDSPEWKAAVELRRVSEYRRELSAHPDMASLRDPRWTERHLALSAQNLREQDVLLAELIDEGKRPDPPPDWVPRMPAP